MRANPSQAGNERRTTSTRQSHKVRSKIGKDGSQHTYNAVTRHVTVHRTPKQRPFALIQHPNQHPARWQPRLSQKTHAGSTSIQLPTGEGHPDPANPRSSQKHNAKRL